MYIPFLYATGSSYKGKVSAEVMLLLQYVQYVACLPGMGLPLCYYSQEASRHADELLKAEEEEKRQAEKKKQRNKKVNPSFDTCAHNAYLGNNITIPSLSPSLPLSLSPSLPPSLSLIS